MCPLGGPLGPVRERSTIYRRVASFFVEGTLLDRTTMRLALGTCLGNRVVGVVGVVGTYHLDQSYQYLSRTT